MENNTIQKVKFCGILWLYGSGLYLTRILPASPVHFVYILSILIVFLFPFYKGKLSTNYISLLLLVASSYFLLLFVSSPPPAVINIIMTFTSPFLVYFFFNGKMISVKWINGYFLFYTIIFMFDGIWRLLHPAEMNLERLEELGILFQIYKLNSFMYMDSNFVGLQAICVLSFMCWLCFYGLRLNKIVFFALCLSVFLTFSRSAIVAGIFVVLMTFLYKRKISIVLLNAIFAIFSFFIGIAVFYIFANDVSFLSKFHIFSVAKGYLYRSDVITLLFGVGIGNAKEYLGIGAHNLFVTFFIETGLIGLAIFLALVIYWFCKLKRGWLLLVFPTLLASMSLGTTALPYLFTTVAVALLMKRDQIVLYGKKELVKGVIDGKFV